MQLAAPRQDIRFCASADGTRIAYATTGEGPPLLRAAHWYSHLEFDLAGPVWLPWFRRLSRGRALVRYDQRGCGLSDRTPAELTLDTMVDDLQAVADAAGLKKFPIIGSCHGGPISLAYAVRHPERVSCIVIHGGYSRGRRKRSPQAAREAEVLMKLVELGWGHDHSAWRELWASMSIRDGSLEHLRWFDTLQRVAVSTEGAMRALSCFFDVDASELATKVRCPVLVLHSRNDGMSPFEEGRRLASLIRGARFVPIESNNHVFVEHEPAWGVFFSEVEQFLAAHAERPIAVAKPFAETLTGREGEILELVACGLDNHQIAARLGLSEKTVRNHVSSVFAKLGADSRARAVVRAREAGFGATALKH